MLRTDEWYRRAAACYMYDVTRRHVASLWFQWVTTTTQGCGTCALRN